MGFVMKNMSLVLFLFVTLMGTSLTMEVPSSTSSYLTSVDKIRLKKVIEPGFKLQDIASVHHAVLGFSYLKEPITNVAIICEFLIKSAGDSSLTIEQIYYLASTWKSLKICQPKSLPLISLTKTLITVLEKESISIIELYHAVRAMILFEQKIPDAIVKKLTSYLQVVIKNDDNVSNLGYVFHVAADMGSASSIDFNLIEQVMIQADEVDGQFLQFEGGLSVTSIVVNGVYKLCLALKKDPNLSTQQIVKLANYFLSRRSVQTPKGVINMLSSINILAFNDFEKPVCITLLEGATVVSANQPLVRIKVCDILGNPLLKTPSATAVTATKVGDDVVVISKKDFQPSSSDRTLFTLDFVSANPEPGFYNIAVAAAMKKNSVTIKVLAEVKLDFLEIGIADADQTTQPKLTRLTYPLKLMSNIEADSQQKLVIRFLLKDNAKTKPIRVHQSFIRISSVSTADVDKQEIIFVAEPDTSHIYKFDMPVGMAAKNFNYRNGDYNVELIVGDSFLSNSFQWDLGVVSLKFPESLASEVVEKSTYKQKPNEYSPKQEIKHMFRQPEKRPAPFVSNLFTGLCLSPILLLIILWIKLGVNVSNFPFSLSAIIFHIGIGSIFILFGIFWLKLNMFTTLRYLVGLGLITFLSGSKLLSEIARNRKSSR